jgi:cytoskeletal protein CcmA (bactofilin family)
MDLRSHKVLVPFIAALSFCSAPPVSAELGQVIPMGDLARWAIFTLGTKDQIDRISNDSFLQGDFGAAGNGDMILAGNATVNSDIYCKRNGTLRVGNGATFTGSSFNNQNALLRNGANEATAASDGAAALAETRSVNGVNLSGMESLSFSGAPGETVVLNLKCFKMSGNSKFTLDGAADTTYIINAKNRFSLAGHASIVLTGGLAWNNILFNVRGKGDEVLLSRNSSFQGVIMANKRTIRVRDNATASGEMIADSVQFEGSGQLIHPPVVSP